MRILLVEDYQDFGENIQAAFAKEGHEVVWVRNAPDALAALGLRGERIGKALEFSSTGAVAEPFDAILLDEGLKGSDLSRNGYRLFRAIQKSEHGALLPPIVLTGTGLAEDTVRPDHLGKMKKVRFVDASLEPEGSAVKAEMKRETIRVLGLLEAAISVDGPTRGAREL